jgi:hypothetical protein
VEELPNFCSEEALIRMRSLVHCILVHFTGEVGVKLRDLPDSVEANLAMGQSDRQTDRHTVSFVALWSLESSTLKML